MRGKKLSLFLEHKAEVLRWKKDLGEAVQNHLKLEKKFDIMNKDTEQFYSQKVMEESSITSLEFCSQHSM